MQLEGIQHNSGQIEALRIILEAKQGRPMAYDEVLEIGESLVSYFKVLAEDSPTTEE